MVGRTPAPLLLAGGLLAVASNVVYRSCTFVAAPTSLTTHGAATTQRLGAMPASAPTSGSSSGASAWPLLGLALAAAGLAKSGQKRLSTPTMTVVAFAPQPVLFVGGALSCLQEADEPCVVMHTDGGRRKRLGVGGRVCMLTGRKKFKGFRRSYSEKKNIRYWRPNTHWKAMWWEREKKWVRLYISARAIRAVDTYGLEKMARRAGLDLYAWCKPHWEPGSRQPLALKVGYTAQALKDKRLWPDYIAKLNKGAALADVMPGPLRPDKPLPWKLRKSNKNPPTPPKSLKVNVMERASVSNAV
ncbi:unnamed protein product [Polarella glacialis]|uniref:Large ribosomal subunit protein bL28c n=2 Tax=Polarella glacialis TaxID=89957 RepID=A0A813H1K9_POLGL|nr:unnamed protein product [Polarella glacialis]